MLDDYAHHPTEVRATLLAARQRYEPRRLWCLFQPHQHSRTRFLMTSFAESFRDADHVVLPDILLRPATASAEREAVCAADLADGIRERGGNAEYVPTFTAIVERVATALAPGDVVVTMGAGDIWKVADELLCRLRSRFCHA